MDDEMDRASTIARRGARWVAAAVAVGLLFAVVPGSSPARKTKKVHVVQAGDSVAKIADFYGVSQRDLCEINGLRRDRPLRIGQELKIPRVLRVAGKRYTVKKGDTLASIAAKFDRTVQEIAHANKMSADAPLRLGRTIVIPDKGGKATTIKAARHDIKPILFLRIRTGERERLRLYNANGSINKRSVRRLSYLCRDKVGGKVKRLHFRLIKMVQLVSEEFPGKPIEIISGYRANSKGTESQHALGRALDFRIPGILGKQLYRFCKTLPRSGCGYYPNSGFIHMDAREKNTTWIDHSD
jgi:uncharacterized protein YcbK (DUF882 family)